MSRFDRNIDKFLQAYNAKHQPQQPLANPSFDQLMGDFLNNISVFQVQPPVAQPAAAQADMSLNKKAFKEQVEKDTVLAKTFKQSLYQLVRREKKEAHLKAIEKIFDEHKATPEHNFDIELFMKLFSYVHQPENRGELSRDDSEVAHLNNILMTNYADLYNTLTLLKNFFSSDGECLFILQQAYGDNALQALKDYLTQLNDFVQKILPALPQDATQAQQEDHQEMMNSVQSLFQAMQPQRQLARDLGLPYWSTKNAGADALALATSLNAMAQEASASELSEIPMLLETALNCNPSPRFLHELKLLSAFLRFNGVDFAGVVSIVQRMDKTKAVTLKLEEAKKIQRLIILGLVKHGSGLEELLVLPQGVREHFLDTLLAALPSLPQAVRAEQIQRAVVQDLHALTLDIEAKLAEARRLGQHIAPNEMLSHFSKLGASLSAQPVAMQPQAAAEPQPELAQRQQPTAPKTIREAAVQATVEMTDVKVGVADSELSRQVQLISDSMPTATSASGFDAAAAEEGVRQTESVDTAVYPLSPAQAMFRKNLEHVLKGEREKINPGLINIIVRSPLSHRFEKEYISVDGEGTVQITDQVGFKAFIDRVVLIVQYLQNNSMDNLQDLTHLYKAEDERVLLDIIKNLAGYRLVSDLKPKLEGAFESRGTRERQAIEAGLNAAQADGKTRVALLGAVVGDAETNGKESADIEAVNQEEEALKAELTSLENQLFICARYDARISDQLLHIGDSSEDLIEQIQQVLKSEDYEYIKEAAIRLGPQFESLLALMAEAKVQAERAGEMLAHSQAAQARLQHLALLKQRSNVSKEMQALKGMYETWKARFANAQTHLHQLVDGLTTALEQREQGRSIAESVRGVAEVAQAEKELKEQISRQITRVKAALKSEQVNAESAVVLQKAEQSAAAQSPAPRESMELSLDFVVRLANNVAKSRMNYVTAIRLADKLIEAGLFTANIQRKLLHITDPLVPNQGKAGIDGLFALQEFLEAAQINVENPAQLSLLWNALRGTPDFKMLLDIKRKLSLDSGQIFAMIMNLQPSWTNALPAIYQMFCMEQGHNLLSLHMMVNEAGHHASIIEDIYTVFLALQSHAGQMQRIDPDNQQAAEMLREFFEPSMMSQLIDLYKKHGPLVFAELVARIQAVNASGNDAPFSDRETWGDVLGMTGAFLDRELTFARVIEVYKAEKMSAGQGESVQSFADYSKTLLSGFPPAKHDGAVQTNERSPMPASDAYTRNTDHAKRSSGGAATLQVPQWRQLHQETRDQLERNAGVDLMLFEKALLDLFRVMTCMPMVRTFSKDGEKVVVIQPAPQMQSGTARGNAVFIVDQNYLEKLILPAFAAAASAKRLEEARQQPAEHCPGLEVDPELEESLKALRSVGLMAQQPQDTNASRSASPSSLSAESDDGAQVPRKAM